MGWVYGKKFFKEGPHLKLTSSLVLGDGSRINFWEDSWCSEEPLCELFPLLYILAGSKGASVKEAWLPIGEEGDETFVLKGPLMIGRWKGWRISSM